MLQALYQSLSDKYYKIKYRSQYSKPYHFTEDWFSPRINLWYQTLKFLKNKPNLKALEIGTYEGRSALWLLENILTSKTSQLVCIDSYPGPRLKIIEERFRANLKMSNFEDRLKLIVARSDVALPQMMDWQFDLIYIDGQHEGEQITYDAEICWKLLKAGGILIFDDYKWPPHLSKGQSPEVAIDAFLEKYKDQLIILHKDYQVHLQKR